MKKDIFLIVLVCLSVAGTVFAVFQSYQTQNNLTKQTEQIQSLSSKIQLLEAKPAESMFCGNDKCDPGETIDNCLDCDPTYCTRACQEQGYNSAASSCDRQRATFNNCCCER